MNFSDFSTAMANLEMAYGKSISESQMDFWFDKFKPWPAQKFIKIVDKHIEESERFPTIAALLKRGNEIAEASPQSEKTPCKTCNSYGSVTAIHERCKFTFRCADCRNWVGRLSEGIPLWSGFYQIQGYVLDKLQGNDSEQGKAFLKQALAKPEFGKEAFRKRELDRDLGRDILSGGNDGYSF